MKDCLQMAWVLPSPSFWLRTLLPALGRAFRMDLLFQALRIGPGFWIPSFSKLSGLLISAPERGYFCDWTCSDRQRDKDRYYIADSMYIPECFQFQMIRILKRKWVCKSASFLSLLLLPLSRSLINYSPIIFNES